MSTGKYGSLNYHSLLEDSQVVESKAFDSENFCYRLAGILYYTIFAITEDGSTVVSGDVSTHLGVGSRPPWVIRW